MKLPKQTLLEALEAVLPVIHPNPVLPITAMVMFTDKWVCGTNLESSLAVVNTTGITGIAVPAEAAKFLRLCGEEVEIDIVAEGQSITMKVASGKHKATFECESLEAAPKMPEFREGTEFLPDLKTLVQFVNKEDSGNTKYIFVYDGSAYSSDTVNMVCHKFGGPGDFHLTKEQAKLISSTSMIKYTQGDECVYLSNGTVFMHTTFSDSISRVPYDKVIALNAAKSTGIVSLGNVADVKGISDLSMMFQHQVIMSFTEDGCTAMSYDQKYSMDVEWGIKAETDLVVSYNAAAIKTAASLCEGIHSGVTKLLEGVNLPVLYLSAEKYEFVLMPCAVQS